MTMNRLLIAIGMVSIIAGLLWPWVKKVPLFHLPGDIIIDRPGLRFSFRRLAIIRPADVVWFWARFHPESYCPSLLNPAAGPNYHHEDIPGRPNCHAPGGFKHTPGSSLVRDHHARRASLTRVQARRFSTSPCDFNVGPIGTRHAA